MKLGDVVRLKSGGPMMTINGVPRHEGDGWLCVWIADDGAPRSNGFMTEALDPVPPTQELHSGSCSGFIRGKFDPARCDCSPVIISRST